MASLWLLTAFLVFSSAVAAEDSDLVLQNGSILTVNDELPEAEALAIVGDRIVYVGTNSGATDRIGRNTRVIDLKGRFVTPGFIDNHVHFESTGQLLYGLNLLDVSEQDAFVARIREVHGRYAPGTWITGGDWSAYETWSPARSAKQAARSIRMRLMAISSCQIKAMIDGFTKDRPVLVCRFDRKVYLANSRVLALAGIRKGLPDPEGIGVERLADGEPTGDEWLRFGAVKAWIDGNMGLRLRQRRLVVSVSFYQRKYAEPATLRWTSPRELPASSVDEF